jgi:hypothetical protein
MANKQTNLFEGDVYFKTSLEPAVYGNGSVRFEGDLIVDGSATITGGVSAAHSDLTGLANDDHTQYALLAGRSGGQILTAGTASSNNLTLRSTTNATKGSIIFDETTATTSNTTGSIRISGGIGISNTTDAISLSNGGTITTAGGVAIAKKLFVGTDLSIGANVTSGTWNGNVVSVAYGGTGAFTFTTNGVLIGNGNSPIQPASGMTYSTNTLTLPKVVSNDTTTSTSNTTGAITTSGGIGISNVTDATSVSNGGSITTAGGVAIAKKLFVGTDLNVGGNLLVTGTVNIPHSGLTGLTSGDDHTQYAFLAGRSGGQIFTAGTLASNNLTLRSTTNATKGSIIFDETTATTSNSTGSIRISGGIGISNTTDAISISNGGTLTTAGGVAIAKKLFVGTDVNIGGNLTITGTVNIPHSGLTGLTSGDDHTQYVLISGRSGGQILTGGILTGNNLTLRSTINATKGSIIFDETTATTSNTSGSILISGGLAISNTTDAVSVSNGGTLTTAGGVAIAKKLFVGTDLSVSGNITSGTWNGSTITVINGGTGATTFTSTSVLLGNGTSAIQSASGMTYATNILTLQRLTSNDTTATTSSTTGSLLISGGIGISNTTDAISSTNGGTLTTAGGLAIAKKAFIGTDLSIGGTITSGIWAGSTISVANGGTGATTFTSTSVLLGNGTSAIQSSGMTYATNTLTLPRIVSNDTTASTSNSTGAILTSGGIGISNSTDAVSTTNGGSISTAGGLAVAKKIFVGDVGSFSNTINMNNTKIINLATPTTSSDAVTKSYVDLAVQGLDTKQSVVVATTVSGTLASSFQNGSVVDGITLATGNRILIKDQANVDNGVYTVNVSGAPTRATDFGSGSSVAGSFMFVERGTVNADTGWVCSSDIGSDVVGTNTLTFTQFSGAGSITAGTGITKTGNTLSVNASQTQVTALGTITTGTWNATTISVANGGTGATTFTTTSVLLGNGTSAIQSASGMTYVTNTLTIPKIVSNDTTTSTTSTTGALLISGGLGISNTTDALSSTNGGTLTTAGGLAVAKKAYIGTDLNVGGNLTVSGSAIIPHSGLTGLTNDDHTQYVLTTGRTGGQLVTGGTATGNNYTIRSTTNATKGSVIFDETTATTSSTTGSVLLSGGLGISNTTDATSSTNGGTISTAGGLAVAKKAYIGTDLNVGGNLTVSGSAIIPHSGLTGLTNDDHIQYILTTGRTGGQVVTGGTATGNNYTIRSTTNATKGSVIFDETTATTSSTTGSILTSGGLGISNTTDAISSTNGGTITTAGGLAVAKKAFIGSDLSVGGALTVTGAFVIPHSGLSGLTSGDDHTQYAFLAGRLGGQVYTAGTASGNSLTLRSTTNATKGGVVLDETTISTSSITGALRVSGGIGIANTTDAVSIINGGTLTSAGGASFAKRVFIGTTLDTGSINITNSTQNTLNINCFNSVTNIGRILFNGTAGTGDFSIGGDGGDVVWQGGGGRALQFGAFHEVRITGGRTTTGALPFIGGSGASFNTIIQNSNDSIGLRVQSNATQTVDLTQWTSSGGTVYARMDNIGNFTAPNISTTNNFNMTAITTPTSPGGGIVRYYTDSSDSLLKSRNSSGVTTIYQPCDTKGDLSTHNGTTNVSLPVGIDGYRLEANSTTSTGLNWNSNAGAYIRDEKTAATNGGGATSGAFFTRTLTTSTFYPVGQTDISLAANLINLDPGVYKIIASVPGNRVGNFTSRLFNVTNNTTLLTGSSATTTTGTTMLVYSFIKGIITVTTNIDVRVEMRVATTRATDGLGLANGFQTETYTQVYIDKL